MNGFMLSITALLLGGGCPSSEPLRVDSKKNPNGLWADRMTQGSVQPSDRPDEESLPEIYRLHTEPFRYEVQTDRVVRGVTIRKVRFPSPVVTKYPRNNTVHGELFRPPGTGPFPCVIVLHIAGGDFELSRFLSYVLAQQGIASLFVKMPYYGERRPAGIKIKMISGDLERGLKAMRQTVLDLRRTCDWIESYSELDGSRIGVMGISLGSITGALAAAIEPRISHACLIIGGAQLQHILYESSERDAQKYRRQWEEHGGTRESFARMIAPYDPATYSSRLCQRVVLMINASQDDVVPHKCNLALWEAAGKQRIVWFPCGHYTMAKYLFPTLRLSIEFFEQWPQR